VVQILAYAVQVLTTNMGALSWMNAEALRVATPLVKMDSTPPMVTLL